MRGHGGHPQVNSVDGRRQPTHRNATPLVPLQTAAGNRAVSDALRVQREPTPAAEDPIIAVERSEWATVPSGPAGSIQLSDPLTDGGKSETAPLTIAAPAPRSSVDGQRKGFDTQSAAVAFAITVAGGRGAGVVKRGQFFFVVTLVPTDGLVREKVYRYTAAQGILMVVGKDGAVFDPSVTRYQVDVDKAGKTDDPAADMNRAASANDLAKLAGVAPVGSKPTDAAGRAAQQDAVQIGVDQIEPFLRQYLVAKGMDMLNQNELAARKLIADFKPSDEKAGTGVQSKAKTMIDKAREVTANLAKTQDEEIKLERTMSDRDWAAGMARTSLKQWTNEGETKTLGEWKTDLEGRQRNIAARKDEIFRQNPLVAQLIAKRKPDDAVDTDFKRIADSDASWILPGKLLWEGYKAIRGSENTAKDGPLAKGSDEEVRAAMLKKLDDVLKALHEVKAKTLGGDLKFLTSMPRLYNAVKADMQQVRGKNAGLAQDLETIRVQKGSEFDVKTAIDIAGQIMQLAGFFFPPLEFIGAAMTFGAAVGRLDEAAQAETVSQAAVSPEQAMMDPDETQKKVSEALAGLAMESANLGMAMGGAAHAIEQGRPPPVGAMEKAGSVKDLLGLSSAKREAVVAESLAKQGPVGTLKEAGGYGTVRAGLSPGSPSLKTIETWQHGAVNEMANVIAERKVVAAAADPAKAQLPAGGTLEDFGHLDFGPASSRPPDSLPPDTSPGPAPTVRFDLTTADVKAAEETLARIAQCDAKDVHRITGIQFDDPEGLKRFIAAAPPNLVAKSMSTLATAEEKAAALVEIGNRYLRSKGVPEMRYALENLGPGVGGNFDASTWTMTLNRTELAGTMTNARVTSAMFLSGHEARHAEQTFMMARLKLADLPTTATESQKLAHLRTEFPGLRPQDDIFREAIKAGPLQGSTAELDKVREWHKSMYVKGFREKRNATIIAWQDAEKRVAIAKKELDNAVNKAQRAMKGPDMPPNHPMYPAQKKFWENELRDAKDAQAKWFPELRAAEADLPAKKAAYKALPEEVDAYEFQEGLQKLYGHVEGKGPTPAPTGTP